MIERDTLPTRSPPRHLADAEWPDVASADGAGASRLSGLLLAGWFLVSGYLLFVAPWLPVLWNDSFHAWNEGLHRVLLARPSRIAISAVGAALLVAGAWDLLTHVGSRRPRS